MASIDDCAERLLFPASAVLRARLDALEEAAKVCDRGLAFPHYDRRTLEHAAEAIRALMEPTASLPPSPPATSDSPL